MKITKETRPHFEKRTVAGKIVSLVVVPLLNYIVPAKTLQNAMKKTSKDAADAVKKSGSGHAMEAMYSGKSRKLLSRGVIEGVSDFVWHRTIAQSIAIRNRLLLVEELLEKGIKHYEESEGVVKILTIAGGTNRSLLNVLDRLYKQKNNLPIKVTNIDLDATALEASKTLAKERNCDEYFTRIHGNAFELKEHCPEGNSHLVEMVGLLDYLNDESAITMLSLVKDTLNDRGMVVSANIAPNSEERFIKKIGWPKMYYRPASQLYDLAIKAGFKDDELEVIIEPMGVHNVLVIDRRLTA